MKTVLRKVSVTLAMLVVLIGIPVPATAGSIGAHGLCNPGWYYRVISRGADTHSQVGPTQSDYNGTGSAALVTLTAQMSGSVSATFSGSTNVGASIKLAEIHTTYGINVQSTITVTIGNQIQISVPSHMTGNGNYGAWRAHTTGVEEWYTSTCSVTSSAGTSEYSPYKVGWNTWIS